MVYGPVCEQIKTPSLSRVGRTKVKYLSSFFSKLQKEGCLTFVLRIVWTLTMEMDAPHAAAVSGISLMYDGQADKSLASSLSG